MKKRRWLPMLSAFVAALCFSCLLSSCEENYCLHKAAAVYVQAPTCETEGYTLHTCATCGHVWKSDFVDPIGHVYDAAETESTCTESGKIVYTCRICGDTYSVESTAPLGHRWSAAVSDPTCENGGLTHFTCRVCGESYDGDPTEPTGHDLYAVVTAPTCTAEGYTIYYCRDCEYSTVVDRVPAAGHEYVRQLTRPTTDRLGYVVCRCSSCAHSYVEKYLRVEDILRGAPGEGKGTLARGVDLSSHNVVTDWNALANEVDFVILRVATTTLSVDSKFEAYYAAAKEAGLDVGCYFVSYATTEKEMARDIKRLQELIKDKTFTYPVYLDIEKDTQRDLGKERLTGLIGTYMTEMFNAGWFPALYTNNDFLQNAMLSDTVTAKYDVWFAAYKSMAPNVAPYSAQYGMWQYTCTGTVGGVTAAVDIDLAFKNYPSMMREYHFNGY